VILGRRIGGALFGAVAVLAAPASAACLSYGSSVTLTGFYGTALFPGSPNYESVKTGDDPEWAALLFVVEPFCMGEDPEGLNEPDITVEVVQLACSSEQLAGFKKSEGTPVTVSGELFGAHTGHHHASVLLACD